jgi:hypothetical protein
LLPRLIISLSLNRPGLQLVNSFDMLLLNDVQQLGEINTYPVASKQSYLYFFEKGSIAVLAFPSIDTYYIGVTTKYQCFDTISKKESFGSRFRRRWPNKTHRVPVDIR